MVRSKKVVVLSVLVVLALSLTGVAYAKVYRAASFSGEPPEEVLGYRVWQDQSGWHIRWTGHGTPKHFSGTIDCDRPIHKVHRYNLEGNDQLVRKPRFLKFDAMTANGQDGIDFKTDGKRIVLRLKVDGRPRTELIHIGHYGWHPSPGQIVITQ